MSYIEIKDFREMKIVQLADDNINEEHICCAISDKKCKEGYEAKKQWLANQFIDGYIFKKFDARGKVFIEYVSVEKAWVPIVAPNYMLINCFWVSGRYKGKGHGKALYQECVDDSKDKDGIVVVVGKQKQPFMSEKKFFQKQGFELSDTAGPYFELWYKKINPDASIAKFKDCAKKAECDNKNGLTVFYTNACPFTEYYTNTELVRVAKEKGIPLKVIKLESKEQAQNHVVPHTIYSVFFNGKFVTQHILNEKNFDRFIMTQ
jgi:ribosomal protein S18 acetylase RimI-like enzyme